MRDPRDKSCIFIGSSRFPNLRCAQVTVDLAIADRTYGIPLSCEAWSVAAHDRFASKRAVQSAVADRRVAGNLFRLTVDEIKDAIAPFMDATLTPVEISRIDWLKSGR
jgi:hypothetical protein